MTYSIVARDPETGELGVAVQSHYFGAGRVVSWARPGVGVVASQALADPSYGPLGLELLAAGKSPEDALAGLVAADPAGAVRQVAMVDAEGRVAVHTGDRCIGVAGHVTGAGWSVQANMMDGEGVPEAMAGAFEATGGDLATRLLAALDAAEAAGGDIRGRQAAGLLVVSGDRAARPWESAVDVRVDDHPDPLGELRRLVGMAVAYRSGEPGAAVGGNPELAFWRGVELAAGGDLEGARPWLAQAYAVSDRWRELLRRLPPAGLFPDDPDLVEAAAGLDR